MYRFLFQLLYFIAWIGYFLVCRLAFHLYHFSKSRELTFSELMRTFVYGSRLDAAFAAYICVLPFLLVVISCLWPSKRWRSAVVWYSIILVVLVSLVQTVDLELYHAWGFRLDATPLQYISSPTEAAASAGGAPVLLLFAIWIVLGIIGIRMMMRTARLFPSEFPVNKGIWGPLTFFLALVLILAMRGGWQQIPINQSSVYFSSKPFANHAGLNVPWNIMYALSRHDYDTKNPYLYLSPTDAEARIAHLFPELPPQEQQQQLVSIKRPNVLLIVLESYTANLVGVLGGEPGVTPNIDSLARQGLLFTRIYSAADRSEKGMAAILSGYPAQPTTSVMKSPRKTQQMPYLSKVFREAGYHTSYYYGGELGFANMKSYLLNGGFDRLTEKEHFNPNDFNSKWGVHDHVLLQRVLTELGQEQQPFFSTVFTLSSHEPYDIPIAPAFPGTDEASQFKNSVYYTDQAIGDFIRQAKQQPWWPHTLVVMVADHGHRFPNDVPIHSPEKFRIPLLFSGGALARTGTADKLGSQTDLATTLLRQLGLPHAEFTWGKDLLHPQAPGHAFYVFNNGFGYLTPTASLAVDNVSQTVIEQSGTSEQDLQNAKAMMQMTFEDFLGR